MRALRNIGTTFLTLALLIGGGFVLIAGVDKMQEKGYIVGDLLSEHIAQCDVCSRESTSAVDCDVAVKLQRDRLRAANPNRWYPGE